MAVTAAAEAEAVAAATGRAEAVTAVEGVAETEIGEAEEGGIRLGKVQQLQRHREDPVQRMPQARLQVSRQRHLQ